MTTRKPPVLMRSGLTGRIYIVTSYLLLEGDAILVRTKFDVTDQFESFARQRAQEQEETSS